MDVDVFTRAFACTPIYDSLFSYLSLHALVQLALACRAAYLAVTDYKSRAFNINRYLSRFFSNPISFRSLQAKTNTLISGLNALQFLDRSFCPEPRLDLYTHPGHSFEVAQFLVEVEGYAFVPSNHQENDWQEAVPNDWDGTQGYLRQPKSFSSPLAHVFTFKKIAPSRRKRFRVHIFEAAASPVEAILSFDCTCMMNFISSNAAYALYPSATLVERTGIGMPKGKINVDPSLSKYIQRGWRVYFTLRPEDLKNPSDPPFALNSKRWVGDNYTSVVPLDQTGVQPRTPLSPGSQPLTFDPVLCYGWELQPTSPEPHNTYRCEMYKVQSIVFRYNYAFPDAKLAKTVSHWAGKQGRHCYEYIGKEDWMWFDGDIPSFLRTEYNREIEL